MSTFFPQLVGIVPPLAEEAIRKTAETLLQNALPRIKALESAGYITQTQANSLFGAAAILKIIQVTGTLPINTSGLPPASGGGQGVIFEGTHAQRIASFQAGNYPQGTLFWETDRTYLYIVGLVGSVNGWLYVAGMTIGLYSGRWTDLGTGDAGALYYASDRLYCYRWADPIWHYLWGVAIGTHAGRAAFLLSTQDTGSLYIETDRNYWYEWSGLAWVWRAGVYVDVIANRPADLGVSDSGAQFYGTDTFTSYTWNGTVWKTTGGAREIPLSNSTSAFAVTRADGTTIVFDVDTSNLRAGINTATPGADLDVQGGGIINVATGFQIGLAAASGRVLRGNGTAFISAVLAAIDLSNGVTGTGRVVLDTAPTIASASLTTAVGFYGTAPQTQPTITGSRGGNVALANLLTALAGLGLIIDSTT